MKLKSLFAAIFLLTATSCVDKDFQIDNVSTQVAVGGDITTLPLGYLDKQKLGDILDTDGIEALSTDADGNYSLSFSGGKSHISIDGIENKFDIPRTTTTFSTEYPSFEITGASCVIDRPYFISTDFGSLHIPEGISVPFPAGHTIKATEQGVVSETLEYEVPKYLAAVKRIYLKPQAKSDKGAVVNLSLSLNDIAAINGGGHITLSLIANDGYELYDKNGNPLQEIDHQGHTTTYQIASNQGFTAGTNQIEFTIYLKSIANDSVVENNKLTIPIEFGYNLSFDITSQANTITINTLPELHINTTLQYHDADIVLNEVMLLEHGALAGNSSEITLNNLPDQIKSIKRVNFSNHSPMHLFAEGLDWLDDAIAQHIVIDAQLPDYLTLHDNQHKGYDAATHTLRTTLDNLRHKIDINLDALVFSGEGITPQDGKVSLDFTPDIAAYIEAGTEVKLSSILHEKQIEFSAGFDSTTLELVSVEGQVEYKYNEQAEIELDDFNNNITFSITNLGLQPVIKLNIENPLTVGAKVSAKLTPVANGEVNNQNCVEINDIEIKAASVTDDIIKSGVTTLILADEALRQNYTNTDYSFVACDLTKLFTGKFPDKILLDFNLSTDKNTSHTIYITDSYTVSFNYDVNIPLTFSDELDITLSKRIENLKSIFENVSDLAITMNQVSIIAEAANTIPLDLEFEAEALSSNGKPTPVSFICSKPNNILKGSIDGIKEEHSTIRITLKLDKEGDISQLAEVDAINLKLRAKRSQDGSVALNSEQYISLKLQVEINEKINVDLSDLQ